MIKCDRIRNQLAAIDEVQRQLLNDLHKDKIIIPTIQSAIRTLQRKQLIGREVERASYYIDDPNFKNWLLRLS